MPSVDINANTRQAQRNVKDLSAALDATADALDDIARDGSRAGDNLERTFRDMVRDSDRASREVGDGWKDAYKKAQKSADDFQREASGNVQEFKNEAKQNFSEVASSFDGSMSSLGDLAQGTLGGIAGSLPGVGLAAGVAAAGIGGLTAHFAELEERSKQTKQAIIDDFLEVGDALDKEAVDARVRDLLGGEDTRKQAELLKQLLGVDLSQAVLALAGDFESAGVKVGDVYRAIAEAPGSVSLDTLEGLKNTVESTNAAFEVGTELARAREDAAERMGETERAQIQRTRDADQARYEAMAALYANPIKATVDVDMRTQAAHQALDVLQRRAAQGITVQLRPEQGRAWQ